MSHFTSSVMVNYFDYSFHKPNPLGFVSISHSKQNQYPPKKTTTSLNSLSTPLMIREFLFRNLTYGHLKWPLIFRAVTFSKPLLWVLQIHVWKMWSYITCINHFQPNVRKYIFPKKTWSTSGIHGDRSNVSTSRWVCFELPGLRGRSWTHGKSQCSASHGVDSGREGEFTPEKKKGETTKRRSFPPIQKTWERPKGFFLEKKQNMYRGCYFTHTWKSNDPCFGWKRPCFGGLTLKNRGHLGSRYI